MCKKLSERTLRFQYLCIFGSFASILLIVAGLCSTLYVGVIGLAVQKDLKNGFLNGAKSDMTLILSNGANLINRKFAQLIANFPGPMTISFEDSYRSDYPFDINGFQNYYNWPDQLPGVSFDTSRNANVTYLTSSINVNGIMFDNYQNLPSDLRKSINQTASMDYLFIPTFNSTPEFYAGYIAAVNSHLSSASGYSVKRYYPGSFNANLQSTYIQFNGALRPWYQAQIAQTPTPGIPYIMAYTAPYFDAINNLMMITIGRLCFISQGLAQGQLLGGFGADLMLDQVQKIVRNLNYLGRSRTLMFDVASGYLIADSMNQITSLTSYSSVSNPSINSGIWNQLLSSTGQIINNDNYDMVSFYVQSNRYILVSIIDHQYILNTFSDIVSQVNKLVNQAIGITIGIDVLLFVIIIIYTFIMTNSIVSPLQKLENQSRLMTQRFGGSLIDNNTQMAFEPTGLDEVDAVNNQFASAMKLINRDDTDEVEKNPYHGNTVWNISDLPPGTLPTYPYVSSPYATAPPETVIPVPVHTGVIIPISSNYLDRMVSQSIPGAGVGGSLSAITRVQPLTQYPTPNIGAPGQEGSDPV